MIDVTAVAAHVAPLPEQRDRSFANRQIVVGDQQFGHKRVERPKPVARFAHALRAVEAEQLRRWRLETATASAAGILGRKQHGLALGGARLMFVCLGQRNNQRRLAKLERHVDRFGDAAAIAGVGIDAIDNDFDVMPMLAIERRRIGQAESFRRRPERAKNPCLRRSSNRSLNSPFWPRTSGAMIHSVASIGRDKIRDVIASRRLGRDPRSARGAVPGADAREQDSQKVIDLGDRADGAARIVAARFLADRNRWAQPADQVDIGLGHLAHELASVIAQTFDITPLAFGVQRIERERRFAASRNPREANQLTARQRQIDIAEIMFAGTFDFDFRRRHAASRCRLPSPVVSLVAAKKFASVPYHARVPERGRERGGGCGPYDWPAIQFFHRENAEFPRHSNWLET